MDLTTKQILTDIGNEFTRCANECDASMLFDNLKDKFEGYYNEGNGKITHLQYHQLTDAIGDLHNLLS